MSMELDRSSNALLANTGSAFCCFGSGRRSSISWWDRVRSTSSSSQSQSQSREVHPTGTGTGTGDHWWWRGLRALKKLREWSEIVAGPRWKTFIRRFNRNRNCKRMANYQYDPLSYALNFDQGHNGDFQEDGYDGFPNFSSRYGAAVPVNVKEVGTGKDVAVLV